MIIKTALNGHAGHLYRHLTRTDDGNEKVIVVETRGCVSDELLGALREMKATSLGTNCEKTFFHVSFAAPQADQDKLADKQLWLKSADRLEQEFGLENHARAIVHHYKDDRWHQHVVWNRIDPETGKAAHLSHEHRRAIKIARELEKELGLTPVSNERPSKRRGQRPPTTTEKEAARRTKVDADLVRDAVLEAWKQSDSGQSFQAALEERGLQLARGETRPFLVIDASGGFYALSGRSLPNEKAATIAEKLKDVAPNLLPLDVVRASLIEQEPEKRYKRGGKGKAGEGGPSLAPATLNPSNEPETAQQLKQRYGVQHRQLKRDLEQELARLEQRHSQAREELARVHERQISEMQQPQPAIARLLKKITGVEKAEAHKAQQRIEQQRFDRERQKDIMEKEKMAIQKLYDDKAKKLREAERLMLLNLSKVKAEQKPTPTFNKLTPEQQRLYEANLQESKRMRAPIGKDLLDRDGPDL